MQNSNEHPDYHSVLSCGLGTFIQQPFPKRQVYQITITYLAVISWSKNGANTALSHNSLRHLRALLCVCCDSINWLDDDDDGDAAAAATADAPDGTGAGTDPDGAGVNDGPVSSSLTWSKKSEANFNTQA